MGLIIGIGLIILVIYLLYLLFIHVIIPFVFPVIGAALLIAAGIGAVYGLYKSIKAFAASFMEHVNPYGTYKDKSAKAPADTRRNYFFGPGMHQVIQTVKDAFAGLFDQAEDIIDFKDDKTGNAWFLDMWIYVVFGVGIFCLFVFGTAWTAIFSILLSVGVLVGMCAFYVFFSLLWLADLGTLWVKSIKSPCGNCKNHSVVPNFICFDCGREHTRLTPGPYGILARKCACASKLPTTFFAGRSRLEAKCPRCGTELAASDAAQFGIQVVGGVSSGKTTFLAAFWHEYLWKLHGQGNTEYDIFPKEGFDQLGEWFTQGITSSATTETNASMYSVVHRFPGRAAFQLNLYDIAGESFADTGYAIQQQQFRYCDGFVFIVDPTANSDTVSDVIAGFINTYKELTGKHTAQMSDIPAAVVISKADLFKKEIGLVKIKTRFKKNPGEFADEETGQGSLERTRNGICRNFLKDCGFVNVVNLVESEFRNIQYYPASAIGREAEDGKAYEPWGVLEPVEWILGHRAAANETELNLPAGLMNKVKGLVSKIRRDAA